MARNYTVQTKINRPVGDVFAAIVSKQQLCNYFTSEATGDMVEGERIGWRWQHYEHELPVVVSRIVPDELIELELDAEQWKKTVSDSYAVRVIFELESLEDGGTMLSISEAGWRDDVDGTKASHDNCSGWTHMAMCLKAWLEHGIDLR